MLTKALYILVIVTLVLLIITQGRKHYKRYNSLKEPMTNTVILDKSKTVSIDGFIPGVRQLALPGMFDLLPFYKRVNTIIKTGTNYINIIINTPGGDLSTGKVLLDRFADLKFKGIEIRCYAKNKVASLGTILFTYCDKRYAEVGTGIMWHSVGKVLPSKSRLNQQALGHFYYDVINLNRQYWEGTKSYFDSDYFNSNFDSERVISGLELEREGYGYLRVINNIVIQ